MKNTKAETDTTYDEFLKMYYISAGQTSIVPEEGWFGLWPKYSTSSKTHHKLCRFLLLHCTAKARSFRPQATVKL